MKTNNLREYISLNILSLFGFFVLAFYVHYFLFFQPKNIVFQQEMIVKYGEDLTSGLYEGVFYFLYLVILFLIVLLILIEIFIRRKTTLLNISFMSGVRVAKNIIDIYNFFFLMGIVVATLPILFLLKVLMVIILCF